MANYTGKLFVFEGPDGSGKSTACKNIAKELNNKSFKTEVICLPFPDNTLYDEIRSILRGEKKVETDYLQQLMIKNMKNTFDQVIIPKLENGINIILDRWLLSTIIYNKLGNGSIFDEIENIYDLEQVINKLEIYPIPDKIFYFNISEDILVLHARSRMKDKNNSEDNDKEENVIKCYKEYKTFATNILNGDYKIKMINVIDESLYDSSLLCEFDSYQYAYNTIRKIVFESVGEARCVMNHDLYS